MSTTRNWKETRLIEIVGWTTPDNESGTGQYKLKGYDEQDQPFWDFIGTHSSISTARSNAKEYAKRLKEEGIVCKIKKEIAYVKEPFVNPLFMRLEEKGLGRKTVSYEMQRIIDKRKK